MHIVESMSSTMNSASIKALFIVSSAGRQMEPSAHLVGQVFSTMFWNSGRLAIRPVTRPT